MMVMTRGVHMRMVRLLHQTLLETGKLSGEAHWLHESFGVTDVSTDDQCP